MAKKAPNTTTAVDSVEQIAVPPRLQLIQITSCADGGLYGLSTTGVVFQFVPLTERNNERYGKVEHCGDHWVPVSMEIREEIEWS